MAGVPSPNPGDNLQRIVANTKEENDRPSPGLTGSAPDPSPESDKNSVFQTGVFYPVSCVRVSHGPYFVSAKILHPQPQSKFFLRLSSRATKRTGRQTSNVGTLHTTPSPTTIFNRWRTGGLSSPSPLFPGIHSGGICMSAPSRRPEIRRRRTRKEKVLKLRKRFAAATSDNDRKRIEQKLHRLGLVSPSNPLKTA